MLFQIPMVWLIRHFSSISITGAAPRTMIPCRVMMLRFGAKIEQRRRQARQYYQHEDVKKEEMRVKTNDFPEWEPAIVVQD